jgi:cytochrome c biogenesis protein CcmG/thiol:disulfide interchange protein DsbE
MRIRWAIAIVGIVALAALTVTTQFPWLTVRQPAMQERAANGDHTSGAAEALSCPADAKRANLDFTMKDQSGRDVSLSQYRGKVILLDFWATWCGPCKVEIPHFIEFQDRYGKDGLQVVGISVDDPLDKLAPYAREMRMNYTILQGLGHDDVQDAFGPILGIPITHMISRDGKICATHTGLTGKDVFEREIRALLHEDRPVL